MVFFLAVSTKTALTLGALVGGTVAILANKEKVMEITADILQKGADILHEELEKHKVKMASHISDGEFDFDTNQEMRDREKSAEDFTSGATTPETTDLESETDEEFESSNDIESHMTELFENIKEKEGDLVFERYRGSSSTLIEKSRNGKLGDSDLELD